MQNYPENIEGKLGFNRIRSWIGQYLLSVLGKQQLENIRFQDDPETIFRLHEETEEFMAVLGGEDPFPLENYADLVPVLERIRIEGSSFLPEELPSLHASIGTLRQITRFFESQEEKKYPRLRVIAGDILVFPYLLELLNKILTTKGTIRDTASPELRQIRRSLNQHRHAISGIMEQLIRKAQREGWVEKDTGAAIRDGRLVVPVTVTHKRRVPGLILDESSTGKTVFIEPAEIVERNNEIRSLEFAERREIEKIMTELANAFRPYINDLTIGYSAMGKFDLLQAKARWALDMNAINPGMKDAPVANWHNAVHPLLAQNLKNEGREVIPLDIVLNNEIRILVISGPNAGGKSVCLQTVGLLQFMFQSGLPVPVGEGSEFGIFTALFLDFGDEQSIDNDLSTYSSRLLNMKYFMKHAGPETLVLMDEFGTGTEPQPGAAIAEVVLQRLNRTGTYGVITTHYTNLKHVAAAEEGMANGAMLFDQQKLEPLFRLDIGKPGSSFAFEIARKMGLSEEVLKDAATRVGEEHVLFDKHLREILRDKRYWENKRRRIRQQEKKMEEVLGKYDSELKALSGERKKIMEEARSEASLLLKEVNKKIENTIRQIREVQADKEKTRQLRAELEELKEKVANPVDKLSEKLEKKAQQISTRRKSISAKQDRGKSEKKLKPRDMVPGDKVRLKGQEIPGEVLHVVEGQAEVAFGTMKSTVSLDRLERVSEEEYKRYQRTNRQQSNWTATMGRNRLDFKSQIDVRGKRANEALQEVMDFIDEAVVAGASNIQILHGKGDGILRQLIRDYLGTVDLISRYYDAHVDQGGSGITVVELL